MIRAAVIGLGVGEQHVLGWDAHPGCEVVAVADLDPARLTRFGHVRTTTDPVELLTDPTIDAVSIASYDDAHFEQIRLALEHGKHVFAEKPLVLHQAEADAIAALLRTRPELRLSTNVPLRRSPRFARVRAAIAAGELGEVFHLEGDNEYGRRHKLTDGWRGRIPYYSVVLGGAIHMVDLLLWLSGQRVTEVVAAEGSRIATRGTAFRHDDFVTALLRTETGATLKVNANLGCVHPHFHAVRVYGTQGRFLNGPETGTLHWPDRSEPVTEAYPGAAKGDLIAPFADTILTGAAPEVSEVDVFNTLSVCLAIEAARESGRRTPVANPLVSAPG
jgi:predicted dehydrogenase